ncbi:response regulator transcription factor [Foetidibacter luteolus]|uniref:response regulator transcription factor n=1 Tax=Foetidibacter luteolus TaxID=2608880 RepID=UPI00129B0A33|nr:response regulator transcription factor [Foetidibacter luteolus]
MRILIAEDEPLMLKTLELKLKKEGYDVLGCPDGRDALNKISHFMPDMVITDIMLPYASGLEIVNAVKAIGEKNIPVIVLSAMGQENTVEEAFTLGADDYVTKPFSLTELAMRIKRLARSSVKTA